jgi:transposase-like protein
MFPVGYRDLELMLLDRGVEVDHITIFRWIQAYAAELEKLIRPHLHMSNGSWRVDETYVTVKGPVDVSVSRHRQPQPDHRLPVVGQARHCGSEAVLP